MEMSGWLNTTMRAVPGPNMRHDLILVLKLVQQEIGYLIQQNVSSLVYVFISSIMSVFSYEASLAYHAQISNLVNSFVSDHMDEK